MSKQVPLLDESHELLKEIVTHRKANRLPARTYTEVTAEAIKLLHKKEERKINGDK